MHTPNINVIHNTHSTSHTTNVKPQTSTKCERSCERLAQSHHMIHTTGKLHCLGWHGNPPWKKLVFVLAQAKTTFNVTSPCVHITLIILSC
uniref:Uncharacterized protein n=1 Tax=Arion vulgaris TaxID=1028688 RepID=A0A0B7AMQ1_9EUPU